MDEQSPIYKTFAALLKGVLRVQDAPATLKPAKPKPLQTYPGITYQVYLGAQIAVVSDPAYYTDHLVVITTTPLPSWLDVAYDGELLTGKCYFAPSSGTVYTTTPDPFGYHHYMDTVLKPQCVDAFAEYIKLHGNVTVNGVSITSADGSKFQEVIMPFVRQLAQLQGVKDDMTAEEWFISRVKADQKQAEAATATKAAQEAADEAASRAAAHTELAKRNLKDG